MVEEAGVEEEFEDSEESGLERTPGIELPFVIHLGMTEEERVQAVQRNFEHLAAHTSWVGRELSGIGRIGQSIREIVSTLSQTVDDIEEFGGAGDGLVPPTPVAAPVVNRQVGTNILDLTAYSVPVDYLAFQVEYATSTDGESFGAWTPLGDEQSPLIPHGNLDYALYYKYRFLVKDNEGNSSGYSPESEAEQPRRANSEGIIDVEAGTITADLIAAVVTLSTLFRTSGSGARVEFDLNGIRVYNASSDLIINFPVTGNAAIEGVLVALGLDVIGNAAFRGSGNFLDVGGVLKLAAGQSDPQTAPSIANTWEQVQGTGVNTGSARGLDYDAVGGSGGATPVYYHVNHTFGGDVFERLASNFSGNRNFEPGAQFRPNAAARGGSYIWVLGYTSSAGEWQIRRYDAAATFGQNEGARYTLTGQTWFDALQVGGIYATSSKVYICELADAVGGTVNIQVHEFNIVAGALVYIQTITTDIGYAVSSSTQFRVEDMTLVGSNFVFALINTFGGVETTGVFRMADTTTGAEVASELFEAPDKASARGVTHDGTDYHSIKRIDGSPPGRVTYTNFLGPQTTDVEYTWYNTGGPYETKVSPNAGAISWKRRAQLTVTTPAIPGAADRARIYAEDTGSPGFKLQATASGKTTVLEDFASGGAAPPGSNNFPTGTAAEVQNAAGDKLLHAGEIVQPIGGIIMYGAAAAPAGWLLCDGSAVSRTTYADLFAVIGTTFGVGDGSTTFNVPDFRQRFPIGKAASGTGSTLGGTGGTVDHRHNEHNQSTNTTTGGTANRLTAVVGGDTFHNTENPPFLAVNYLIKY